MTTYEICVTCGERTGRAGRGEDSIFCEICDDGPFCRECADDHIDQCAQDNGQFGVGA